MRRFRRSQLLIFNNNPSPPTLSWKCQFVHQHRSFSWISTYTRWVLYPKEGRPSIILGSDVWTGSLNPLLLAISYSWNHLPLHFRLKDHYPLSGEYRHHPSQYVLHIDLVVSVLCQSYAMPLCVLEDFQGLSSHLMR